MMNELTNSELLDFLKEEISCHQEVPDVFRCDLNMHLNDTDFWEELSEYLDCFRICDACHGAMIEGYCIDDGQEHYCSDDCLRKNYTDDEIANLFVHAEGVGTSYYTNWYEDSKTFNK